MEYDCQLSYNVLSPDWKMQRLQDAFDSAATTLDIVRDEETILDTIVDWDFKGTYMSWHWTTTSGTDPRFVYKSYMLSMWGLENSDTEPYNVTLGWSGGCGKEGGAMSLILTGRIRELFSPSDSMEISTVLHEWGHMRAALPHLCTESGVMDYVNHNEGNCVMGSGVIAPCTGERLDENMHYCGKCIGKLKDVEW